ncbi:MAG: MFS transporter [Chloroflexi bacterium]|nr:MFS transporter [Chloroflexota bacterium]
MSSQTFVSFKNSAYRFYYGGLLGQMTAMNMQQVANSLLIYRLTGSAAILGVMSLANAVSMLFLSLFGGTIADRVQKKYVMLIEQVSSAMVALGIALALTFGYLSQERAGSWWILVMTSFLQGAIMGLAMPSRQAIIREIVSNEQLMNAVALNTLAMSSLRLIAPGVAGFLIDALDFKAVYYAMTAMYLMSVVSIAFLPRTTRGAFRGSSPLADIKGGFRYIISEPSISLVLLFTLFVVLLSMPYQQLMPIFTDDILKVGAKGLGILMSVSGIGAITSSLLLAPLPNKKRGLLLLASSFVLGLALVGFAFSGLWFVSLTLSVFIGLGQTGRMALSNILLQHYVRDEYRGRVMSIYMMEFGLTSFATFAAALLAEQVGVQWAVGSLAIVLVVMCLVVLAFVPRLRKLD